VKGCSVHRAVSLCYDRVHVVPWSHTRQGARQQRMKVKLDVEQRHALRKLACLAVLIAVDWQRQVQIAGSECQA
jgi:hypothetical protein